MLLFVVMKYGISGTPLAVGPALLLGCGTGSAVLVRYAGEYPTISTNAPAGGIGHRGPARRMRNARMIDGTESMVAPPMVAPPRAAPSQGGGGVVPAASLARLLDKTGGTL